MAARKPVSGLPKSQTGILGGAPIQGPTIGGGSITMENPKFDDRLFPALPHCGPVFRGLITEYQPPGPWRLRFMYNPNEIAYGFELSGSLIPMDQTAGVPTAGAIGGHSLTFELAFDRHYEVAYKKDKLGVFQDITALKALVGIKDETSQGFMMQKVLKFMFGENFIFYGFVNSMSVNIAYFSEKMVPMRAVVQMTATFVPPVTGNKWHNVDADSNVTLTDAGKTGTAKPGTLVGWKALPEGIAGPPSPVVQP